MATKLSEAGNANVDIGDARAASDAVELDGESEAEPPAPTPATAKDPMIRRKIEDKLERIRLREELGIYDEDRWKDL